MRRTRRCFTSQEPSSSEGSAGWPARRSSTRYDRPERFDPTRTDSRPLRFGGGQHFCLGYQLARLEAEVAIPALLDRFPRLALGGVPTRRDRLALRGFESLPVTVR
ncbi:cytochrome P450 [Kitasatospora sp. NPDC058190]|uniref:cytochrome P450 n=1 Tax=Kitasatospora sp. NPDC058190 TaxID=3346371 RepID=UPI0036DBDD84